MIRASSYDQTCSKDLDCMLIAEGNGCVDTFNCGRRARDTP